MCNNHSYNVHQSRLQSRRRGNKLKTLCGIMAFWIIVVMVMVFFGANWIPVR